MEDGKMTNLQKNSLNEYIRILSSSLSKTINTNLFRFFFFVFQQNWFAFETLPLKLFAKQHYVDFPNTELPKAGYHNAYCEVSSATLAFIATTFLWRSGGLSHLWVSIGGYIRIYLTVYGPEIIIGGFGLEEKSQKRKAVCGQGRTNYGGLWNVRPPIIDPR